MQNVTIGERLQQLRKEMKYTQKEFAEFLDIPQPSISAYENNRNSPTVDVLVNIATKCNISLDWLCGLSASRFSVSTMSDVMDLLYVLFETNELKLDIDVHDRLYEDIETETDRWHTSLTIYGNDRDHICNGQLCLIIKEMRENINNLNSYAIDDESYEFAKSKCRMYYGEPRVTRKEPKNLPYEDRIRKHYDWLQEKYGTKEKKQMHHLNNE